MKNIDLVARDVAITAIGVAACVAAGYIGKEIYESIKNVPLENDLYRIVKLGFGGLVALAEGIVGAGATIYGTYSLISDLKNKD
jgi:hypothetical protein